MNPWHDLKFNEENEKQSGKYNMEKDQNHNTVGLDKTYFFCS